MKVTNKQLKILIPLVREECKRNPNKDMDELLNYLIDLAQRRGTVFMVRGKELENLTSRREEQ